MLGHASAAMTLDVHADLFDSDLDAVADRLETLPAPFAAAEVLTGCCLPRRWKPRRAATRKVTKSSVE